jgi:hypothetical protein
MRVCNQPKPYKIYLSVNLLFTVCVKTVTNDTVKGSGFDSQKSDGAFLHRILDYKYLILAYAKHMIAFTFRSILVSYLRPGKI